MAGSFWIGWKMGREKSRRTRKQQGTDEKMKEKVEQGKGLGWGQESVLNGRPPE